ncbi:uncharacterized protein F5147DRAFT_682860 [Suillus discolor]|uniref:Uncharacterized protein n=1 Tax=Suillus discolor TaxID=1912936 RepID=A0A9P7JWT5_9AGAM|nr:uncharacterized protein F5147DRAFT_682860 [Suillus discolor]KAG2113132.1 hypothetical protein F5147DRAFT_682860 [Suillus discolor]
MMRCAAFIVVLSLAHCSFLTTMATSESQHCCSSRYPNGKKWRYDVFIAAPDIGDIRVNVFTFGANTACLYLLDLGTGGYIHVWASTKDPEMDDMSFPSHRCCPRVQG